MNSGQQTGGAAFRAAHLEAHFNLADEPWIPVRLLDSTTQSLGLRSVFSQAHNIAQIAVPDPVNRAAVTRLLIALTAQMIRLSGQDKSAWNRLLDANSGFSPEQVEVLFDDQEQHLWLYHPHHPFLQDTRLLNAMDPISTQSIAELIPTIPGKSESAWFTKPTDSVARTGRDPATVALLLTARWFYALPGNSSVIIAEGERLTTQAGGAFSEGPATITHAFRVGPSLFHTLLRNLTPALAEAPTVGITGPAWGDPGRPQLTKDGLYLATTTATSTLIGEIGPDQMIGTLVRGGIPRAKAVTIELRDIARDQDPHRIASVKVSKSGPSSKTVRVEPGQHRLRTLEQIRAEALASSGGLRGVVNPGDLWLSGNRHTRKESIEFVSGSKQGMAASPKWQDTSRWTSEATYLDSTSLEFRRLAQCLEACFAPKSGVLTRLNWALRLAVGEISDDGKLKPADQHSVPAAGLLASASAMFLDGAGVIVDRAVSSIGDSNIDEAALTTELYRLAQRTYSSVLRPFENSPRFCESIIRSKLTLTERKFNG